MFIGQAPILAATAATNGNIYVIGKILNDQNKKLKSRPVLEELQRLPYLSTFNSLLKRTNYPKVLQG